MKTNAHPGRGETGRLRDRIAELEAEYKKLREENDALRVACEENDELRAFRDEVLEVCAKATLVTCTECGGTGVWHRIHGRDANGGLRCENVPCETCGGSGLSLR